MTERGLDEDGFATVWTIAATGLVVMCAVVAMTVATAVIARHRAAAAADSAAVAAALRVVDGPGVACAAASGYATRDGGRLVTCSVTGADVDVSVAVGLPEPLGSLLAGHDAASARSRAGP